MRSSLEFATSPTEVEYLLNISRYISRNPDVKVMYGTTRNEAFHNQLKAYYRNVMLQTGRNATLVASIVTAAKLVSGTLRVGHEVTVSHAENQLLQAATSAFVSAGVTFRPKLHLRTVGNPDVDEAVLPAGARRLRKRPAAALAAQGRSPKRPRRG